MKLCPWVRERETDPTSTTKITEDTRRGLDVFDFNRPPPYKRDLRSSRMLRGVDWYFVTDVSGQSIGLIVKGQAVRLLGR